MNSIDSLLLCLIASYKGDERMYLYREREDISRQKEDIDNVHDRQKKILKNKELIANKELCL